MNVHTFAVAVTLLVLVLPAAGGKQRALKHDCICTIRMCCKRSNRLINKPNIRLIKVCLLRDCQVVWISCWMFVSISAPSSGLWCYSAYHGAYDVLVKFQTYTYMYLYMYIIIQQRNMLLLRTWAHFYYSTRACQMMYLWRHRREFEILEEECEQLPTEDDTKDKKDQYYFGQFHLNVYAI